MWDFFKSLVDFLGKLIPSSGKKRKVKTIDADGSVWDKDKETPTKEPD